MSWKKSVARIVGNAGVFFASGLGGSILATTPALELGLWVMTFGLIISTSRELLEYAREKERV